jgi:hypothetical protein
MAGMAGKDEARASWIVSAQSQYGQSLRDSHSPLVALPYTFITTWLSSHLAAHLEHATGNQRPTRSQLRYLGSMQAESDSAFRPLLFRHARQYIEGKIT